MKKRLLAISLLMSLVASGAVADSSHYATASTKTEAKRLATAEARSRAKAESLCYRPARQVRECVAVEGGVRCRADTTNDPRTCRRVGWVNEYTKDYYAVRWDPWRMSVLSTSTPSIYSPMPVTTLYGRWVPVGSGPPAPPPFPSN